MEEQRDRQAERTQGTSSTLDAETGAVVVTTEEATARVKHSFSRQHLTAARLFAALATRIEAEPGLTEAQRSEHRAHVTGAVVFSTAFLEASISELYLEAVDRNRDSLRGLSDQQISLLAELWKIVEGRDVLAKYQVALAACGAERFDHGAEPFQGAAGLIKMRNALIHYQPEWDDELKDHKAIQDRLSGRFDLNAHADPGSLWFPHRCLGAGCANWAAKQVEQFMAEFCGRMGIPNRLP